MPVDGLNVKFIAEELDGRFRGARVNKISQIGEAVIFSLHKNVTEKLYASPDKIYVCAENLTSPAVPPNFCMVLRKHLNGAVVTKISALPYERIVKIDLEARDDLFGRGGRCLIAELMGRRGNVFLTDGDGKIIDALKTPSLDGGSSRRLFAGLPYVPPPAAPDAEGLRGVSKASAAEVKHRARVSGASLPDELDTLYGVGVKPTLYFENGKPAEFSFTPYKTLAGEQKTFDTFCEALTLYYGSINADSDLERERKRLLAAVKSKAVKDGKLIVNLDRRIEECADAVRNKLYGDLITANIYKIKPRDEFLKTENFYDCGELVEIPLDKRYGGAENARRYYKKYQKQKTGLAMAERQKAEAEERLAYLNSVKYFIESAGSADELKNIAEEIIPPAAPAGKGARGHSVKNSASKPDERTAEGYKIYIGKNNIQNEYIVKKLASDTDIWLHVQNAPGSHTLVKTTGKVPDSVLLKAACAAAFYSSQKNSGKVAVDYCLAKHLKKHPSGLPGRVIYTDFKTLIVKPEDLK